MSKKLDIQLGQKLRRIREECGLGAWDTAQALKLTQLEYAAVEMGAATLTTDQIVEFCILADVSLERLFDVREQSLPDRMTRIASIKRAALRLENTGPGLTDTELVLLEHFLKIMY